MSDEKFEEFLQREARAFNAPPSEVPREEMWAVIARARASAAESSSAATASTTLATTGATSGSRRTHRPSPLRFASWMGMAATLLIGVGIGRFVLNQETGSPGPTQIATEPAPDVAAPAIGATSAVDRSLPDAAALPDSPVTPDRRVLSPRVTAQTPRAATVADAATGLNGRAREGDGTTYSVASQQHLARAEALISVVSAAPRDAVIDSLTATWARDILSNTRLLMDSPAGADPVRRRLLEDLETLLVQLVQRSGAAVEERALIDRTLERTQLLTRLRTGAAGT